MLFRNEFSSLAEVSLYLDLKLMHLKGLEIVGKFMYYFKQDNIWLNTSLLVRFRQHKCRPLLNYFERHRTFNGPYMCFIFLCIFHCSKCWGRLGSKWGQRVICCCGLSWNTAQIWEVIFLRILGVTSHANHLSRFGVLHAVGQTGIRRNISKLQGVICNFFLWKAT